MTKINKIMFIIIINTILLLFSSCADVKIVGEVTENNTASFSYNIVVDTNKMDSYQDDYIKQSLMFLKNYWSDLGYTSNLKTQDNKYLLTCNISKNCANSEEAFAQLFNYMTSDISPLSNFEYEYNQYYFYDEYVVKGSLDPSNIVSQEIYEEYPISVSDAVDDALKSSKITVELILPFNQDYDTGVTTSKTFKHKVPLNKSSEFEFNGKINNKESSKKHSNLLESRSQYKKLVFILAGLGIVFMIILCYSIVKSRKHPK